MTPEWAQVWVSLMQCGLIAWGILSMRESNKGRDVLLEAVKEQSAGIRALLERGA